MAENAGSIFYTVDIETDKTLKAQAKIGDGLDSMSAAMGRADKASGALGGGLSKTAVSIKAANASAMEGASAFGSFVGVLTAFATGALAKSIVANTAEADQAITQLETTLKSTGRFTPELSKALQDFGAQLQSVSTFGDDAVVASEALLLTFTQVGDEAFPRAQRAILDVATALGTDLKSATLQVGKALNDPVLGMTALSRSGIQFSESQKDVVKALVETGDVASAQAIILGELERQFGGSAEAARNTLGGALTALHHAFGNLLEGEGTGVVDATAAINDLTAALEDPAIKAAFGTIVAGVLNVTAAIAKAMPELVGFTTWAAESLAAAFSGPAGDDIDRLTAKLAQLEAQATRVQESGGTIQPWMTAELEKYGTLLQMATESQQKLADVSPAPPPVEPQVPALMAELSTATEDAAAAKKKLNEAEKVAKAEAKERQTSMAEDVKLMASLQEAIYQTSLSAGELAQRQAELRLSSYATPEQIEQVRLLSAELQALEAKQAARKEFGTDPAAKIKGSTPPLQGGPFDEQAARFEAEKLAEEQRYAEQLERLRQAKEAEVSIRGGYQALEEQMAAEHAARLQQIDQAKNSAMLVGAETAFSGLADAAKTYAGEQSGIYKALFAASKIFGIAQATVAIQTGIAMAAANPWPANLAAMASVAAATGSLVSSISSVNMAGGRALGGPVQAGSMYRVNEGGKPEIFNAANGQQYMMPNQRGEVVSNKDAQGDGSGGTTVNITVMQSTEKAGTVERRADGNGEAIDIFVADIGGGGPASRTLERTYGLRRQGQ